MQMWFSQYHTVHVKLDVRIQEQLFSGQSDYQKIDVFKSVSYTHLDVYKRQEQRIMFFLRMIHIQSCLMR